MRPKPFYCIECLDVDEALELLAQSPPDSHIEVVPKESGELVMLWVPVPEDVIAHELAR